MKTRKGLLFLKIIAFVLLFCVCFFTVQDILRYKGENAEDMKARYDSYRDQIRSGMDVDVLFVGSSPVYAAVSPMIIWKEAGITGMNLATSNQTVMALYYSLLNAFETALPKAVVLDFRDLHEFRPADDDRYYYVYRKTHDTIESIPLKLQLAQDVFRTGGGFEYLFPIFNQHERWCELGQSDFGYPAREYYVFGRGALMRRKTEEVVLSGTYDEDLKPVEHDPISLSYYEKIIDLCREKGIKLFCLIAPSANLDKRMAVHNGIRLYCEEKEIPILNYNEPSLVKEIDLDYAIDFYNEEHLNANGAVKLSSSLAGHLDELFDLPDHRGDPAYEQWDTDWELFTETYGYNIKKATGARYQ